MVRAGRRASSSGWWSPAMLVPAALLLAVFLFWPLVRTVQLSFTGSDILGDPTRFVGFDDYVELLTDPDFVHTVVVSIVIALLGTVLATGLALAASLLLRERIAGSRVLGAVLSLPFAYSAASASVVFAGLFAPTVGVLNVVLGAIGINGPAWLSDPVLAVLSIAIATAWYEFGFAFLVLTAAVRDVPSEVIEAASLDGAGGLRLAGRIVVPLVRPSLLFLAITQTISGLQNFAQIQVLTQGGPGGATTTFIFRLYQLAFGNGTPDFGRASVVAVVLIALVGAVTAVQFRLLGRERVA